MKITHVVHSQNYFLLGTCNLQTNTEHLLISRKESSNFNHRTTNVLLLKVLIERPAIICAKAENNVLPMKKNLMFIKNLRQNATRLKTKEILEKELSENVRSMKISLSTNKRFEERRVTIVSFPLTSPNLRTKGAKSERNDEATCGYLESTLKYTYRRSCPIEWSMKRNKKEKQEKINEKKKKFL